MPYVEHYIPKRTFLTHKDIKIYCSYKDNNFNEELIYWFSCFEEDDIEKEFDVRELSCYDDKLTIQEVLIKAIDLRLYDEIHYTKQPTKTLNVSVICEAWYKSSIEVPIDLSLEEAIEYAVDHLQEIPIKSDLEYISDSDTLDIENCNFDEGE